MNTLTNTIFLPTDKTIRERLVDRFKVAKDRIGSNWRKELSEEFPEKFDSLEGAKLLDRCVRACYRTSFSKVDDLELVVIAMESVAQTRH